ncbi:MAG: YciI family protein [Candidatus Korobacteraceae bacterium]
MKYMLMMTGTMHGFEGYRAWSQDDVQTHYAYLKGINQELADSGELVEIQRLAWPAEAKVVRAGKDSAPFTDGVFPESKEFLAGYWIVEVPNAERAYEIAARLSSGPGPDGTTVDMPIEVRQVMG